MLTVPGCPEMPCVRREERLAIARAGHPGAVLLRCEVGGGGSGRRHAPIPEAAASPSRDVAARHACHVPEAAARQTTKPDSAVHSRRDEST